MYNEIYLTSEEKNDLEDHYSSIVKNGFIKDCKSFSKRLNFNLTVSPQSNKQLAFVAIKAEVEALPKTHKFYHYFNNTLEALQYRYAPNGNVWAYRDFAGLSAGYGLLCSPVWRELDLLKMNLSMRGLNTDSFMQSIIDNGNIKSWLSLYDRNHCNPIVLAATEKLQKTLDQIFKDKTPTERYKIGLAVQQYANKQDMTFHELHEVLNNK